MNNTKLSKFEYYDGKYLLHVVSSCDEIHLKLNSTKIIYVDSFPLAFDNSKTIFIFEVSELLETHKIELLDKNYKNIAYSISNRFPVGKINFSHNKINNVYLFYKDEFIYMTSERQSELKFISSLIKNKKWKQLLIRTGYKFYNKNKNIIVMDRPEKAGDCGEAFYDELLKKGYKNIFFGISFSKAVPGEIERLKRKNYNLLDYDSSNNNIFKSKWKQKVIASKIVLSSTTQNLIYETNEHNFDYIKDICNLNVIFLSHGVFQGPLKTQWINPYNEGHKVDYFVANCEVEAKLLEDKNSFNEIHDWVLRTGMPRYSAIPNNIEENILGIFPTWRKELFYSKKIVSIRDNEVFEKWKSLLENKKLIECLELNGWKIDFVLHPLLCKFYDDFKTLNSDYVTIWKGFEIDYNEKIGKAKIGLTDYSGIIYDIAYKNKPTFYYHFTKLSNHTYESSFDYANDVPVNLFEDEDKLVLELTKTIEKPIHVDNSDFFFHQGENHSDVILKMLKEKDLI